MALLKVRLEKALYGKLRTGLFPTIPGSQGRFCKHVDSVKNLRVLIVAESHRTMCLTTKPQESESIDRRQEEHVENHAWFEHQSQRALELAVSGGMRVLKKNW